MSAAVRRSEFRLVRHHESCSRHRLCIPTFLCTDHLLSVPRQEQPNSGIEAEHRMLAARWSIAEGGPHVGGCCGAQQRQNQQDHGPRTHRAMAAVSPSCSPLHSQACRGSDAHLRQQLRVRLRGPSEDDAHLCQQHRSRPVRSDTHSCDVFHGLPQHQPDNARRGLLTRTRSAGRGR
jgi:hypothetical protein